MSDLITTYDKENKIWKGMAKEPSYDANVSIGEIALTSLRRKNPNDIMQISDSENTEMTYGAALTTAIRIAQYFKDLNLDGDDVVGIVAPECTYLMPVALACWFNATPFQAINAKYDLDVIRNLYGYSTPKIIFCDGLQYEKVKQASASFRPLIYTLCNHLEGVRRIEDLLESTSTEESYRTQPLKYGAVQTMAILTSSGTSGAPKGVCIPNRIFDFGFANETTIMFSPSGVDWMSGFLVLKTNIIKGGIRIITTKPFTPEYLLEIIVKYKVNFLSTNSRVMIQASLLKNYTKETMQSINLIVMSGDNCKDSYLEHIRKPLSNGLLLYGYGGTEFGGVAVRYNENKPKSVGRLFTNIHLKIKDKQSGLCLGPQETGELWIYPGYIWQGYYNNPQATAEIMDEQNFIRTGDLGYMDEDNFLFLVGRCKDVMKYDSFQYSPSEIEGIITELPDVLDVCVFSVFDEFHLDVPAAAVVKREGSSLTEMDIIKYVESKTEMIQKRIHYGVFFLAELPRNFNGKLLRNKVKEICLKMEDKKL